MMTCLYISNSVINRPPPQTKYWTRLKLGFFKNRTAISVTKQMMIKD